MFTNLGTVGISLIPEDIYLTVKSFNLVHSYKKGISSPITALSQLLLIFFFLYIEVSSVVNRQFECPYSKLE